MFVKYVKSPLGTEITDVNMQLSDEYCKFGDTNRFKLLKNQQFQNVMMCKSLFHLKVKYTKKS